jgi:hypothetical protein
MRKIDRIEKKTDDLHQRVTALEYVLMAQGLAHWFNRCAPRSVTTVTTSGKDLRQQFELLLDHLGLEMEYQSPQTRASYKVKSVAPESPERDLAKQNALYKAMQELYEEYCDAGNEVDEDVQTALRTLIARYDDWLD